MGLNLCYFFKNFKQFLILDLVTFMIYLMVRARKAYKQKYCIEINNKL